ncbi:MAG: hypothetical protein LUG24_04170 [Clostridiales bacterium]|nr:hypothetical protein [Clostridiales bacterium]
MNKKLPIYILVIYFIFVLVILAVQLMGNGKREFVSVKLNERLEEAVVIYDESSVMLKGRNQTFIDENNTSRTPVVENNITYLPLSFYKNGFNALTSYSDKTSQATIKYNNMALVMNIGSSQAVISDAERDRNIEIEYAPQIFGEDCYVPVRTFVEVFDFELFYYDGLIIISNTENIFDAETETESIEQVKALVYNLPAAGSYSTVMSLYPEDGEEAEENEETEDEYVYLQTETEQDLYIICQDEYVYYTAGGRVIKADDLPYGEHNRLCSLVLPTGFSAEKIDYSQGYVCVSGTKGNKAAFCLIDMSGEYGIIRKYVAMEGSPEGVLYSDGYFYFCTLSTPEESAEDENGFVPTDYENMRYFPEVSGGGILNICGINLNKLSEPAVISSFFGTDGSFTFCESGIYAAEADNNRIYGDSDEAHSNVYKLSFERGEVVFQRKTRIEGTAALTAREKPVFITQNNDKTSNIYVLDSLLDVSALNPNLDINPRSLTEGEKRIFALEEDNIAVIDSKTGEILGNLDIPDEKMYLYSDNRIIGFTQITPEEMAALEEASEPSEEESLSEEDSPEEESIAYPSIKMTMYDISDPKETEIISEEIIDNTDPSMFRELKIEMGGGVVILPVKIWQEDSLYSGLYAYMENSYYGLRFQGVIE